MSVALRPYDPATDEDGLYACKRAFERGLGATTGGDEKAAAYEGKLTGDYRERWLAWVDRCAADDPRCVTVAVAGGGVVGYVFCLPERLAFVWDAAVINELYVAPDHRGTGVADDLMAAALDLAAVPTLPLGRIVPAVDPKNQRAPALNARPGFGTWGEMMGRTGGSGGAPPPLVALPPPAGSPRGGRGLPPLSGFGCPAGPAPPPGRGGRGPPGR